MELDIQTFEEIRAQQFLTAGPVPVPDARLLKSAFDELASRVGMKAAMEQFPLMCAEMEAKRARVIRQMCESPYEAGYIPQQWLDAKAMLDAGADMVAVFGGNRSSKTQFSVWLAVRLMLSRPQSRVLFLHTNSTSGIDSQHAYFYANLPEELKPKDTTKKKRYSVTTKLNYSISHGWADGVLSLPNSSMARFGSYEQDVAAYEGTQWHLICADENLPKKWKDRLLMRLPSVRGKMVWTFTAIDGLTPGVRDFVDGAVVVSAKPAPLLSQEKIHVPGCRPGEMPYQMRSVSCTGKAGDIIFFHSLENPFLPKDAFINTTRRMPESEIKCKAYGWADSTVSAFLPTFCASHIVEPENIPMEELTFYMALDPALNREYFMLWAGVDAEGRIYVVDEFPDKVRFGAWAEPANDANKFDGKPGPAQPSRGFTLNQYKREILAREGWVEKEGRFVKGERCMEVFRRFVDSRSGNTAAVARKTNAVSLVEMMQEEEEEGGVLYPRMFFESASGLPEQNGQQLLNTLLGYDKQRPMVRSLNEPSLYVSRRCQQTIWAMQNYTGNDGEKAACKDPIDALRYLVQQRPQRVTNALLMGTPGGM